MIRLVACLLPLAFAACSIPMGQQEAASERQTADPRYAACRAEATRLVQFRDRGQQMRTDEAENRLGTDMTIPYSRTETDRLAQQMERDRLITECLRDRSAPATPR